MRWMMRRREGGGLVDAVDDEADQGEEDGGAWGVLAG